MSCKYIVVSIISTCTGEGHDQSMLVLIKPFYLLIYLFIYLFLFRKCAKQMAQKYTHTNVTLPLFLSVVQVKTTEFFPVFEEWVRARPCISYENDI